MSGAPWCASSTSGAPAANNNGVLGLGCEAELIGIIDAYSAKTAMETQIRR